MVSRYIAALKEEDFGYEKIEFKFSFDFSEISKEEKKLADALDGSTPAETENAEESDEEPTEAEIEN